MEAQGEIERKLLYSVIVAGKSARFADNALDRFLFGQAENETPFGYIKRLIDGDRLYGVVRASRCGNYSKTLRCFTQVIDLDLKSCSVSDLEAVHGIGPKTARFFVLWTRPGARVAALDTHVLKWLRAHGQDAPKSTPPSGKRYDELERAFLQDADDMGLTPRELDYKVWSLYAGYVSQSTL